MIGTRHSQFWSQLWNVFGTVCLGNQSGRVSRGESVLKIQSWESVIRSLESLGEASLGSGLGEV